jgi:hypothetical protein
VRTQRYDTCRAAARTTYLFFAPGALIAALVANSASAALIVDALSYDGSVRSGLVTGIEEHSTLTNFPPPNAGIGLPATNPPLPAPLLASNNLTMTATTTQELFPSPGGILYDTLIVQISSPTGNVFANALDNTLTFPVQADLFLFSNTPGMKAVVNPAIIGVENFDFPFDVPVPGSYLVSGLGTQANPLHIQLRLTAAQVDDQNGFLKLHLRYSEMVVPEPTAGLILVFGMACLVRTAIRGHRR